MRLSRRLVLAGGVASLAVSCGGAGTDREDDGENGPLPAPDPAVPGDAVDAVFDVLLPSDGEAPGARDVRASDVLRLESFVPLAMAQGLIPPLPDAVTAAIEKRSGDFRAAVNATLDAMAFGERALSRFLDLPKEAQARLVARAFDDPATRPIMLVVRAAAFTAYLGAITGDAGLRAVGFPGFVDFGRRIANHGDRGFSYGRAPLATQGDDLTDVLDENGDLR